MKRRSLLVCVVAILSVAFFAFLPEADAGRAYIEDISFDGDCASVTFDSMGAKDGVTIRLRTWTRGSSGWRKVHDVSSKAYGGNYKEFCGLRLHRGTVKVRAEIWAYGSRQDSMTRTF